MSPSVSRWSRTPNLERWTARVPAPRSPRSTPRSKLPPSLELAPASFTRASDYGPRPSRHHYASLSRARMAYAPRDPDPGRRVCFVLLVVSPCDLSVCRSYPLIEEPGTRRVLRKNSYVQKEKESGWDEIIRSTHQRAALDPSSCTVASDGHHKPPKSAVTSLTAQKKQEGMERKRENRDHHDETGIGVVWWRWWQRKITTKKIHTPQNRNALASFVLS
jgi:hypothetical protein